MKLNDKIYINNTEIKNRIVMPPLVCFNWCNEDGYETVSHQEHYENRAKGGTGLIVIEATAISNTAKLADKMLGLWEDGHINQFTDIASGCHRYDSTVIVQLLHAGYKSTTNPVYSSSEVSIDNKYCKELSIKEIKDIKKDFVDAAIRAEKAGLDGIEIHGAHHYLLNQFTSSSINKRTDIYGGSLENRCRLSLEITSDIRKVVNKDFIVGYRFGVNDETFKEDIYLLEKLDEIGIDFFNISIGYSSTNIDMPKDFRFSPITYMGVKLKDYTKKPVACVYGIRRPEDAIELVEKYNIPFVAIGKGLLADPEWGNKAFNNLSVDVCYECEPMCKYIIDGKTCAQYIRRNKKNPN